MVRNSERIPLQNSSFAKRARKSTSLPSIWTPSKFEQKILRQSKVISIFRQGGTAQFPHLFCMSPRQGFKALPRAHAESFRSPFSCADCEGLSGQKLFSKPRRDIRIMFASQWVPSSGLVSTNPSSQSSQMHSNEVLVRKWPGLDRHGSKIGPPTAEITSFTERSRKSTSLPSIWTLWKFEQKILRHSKVILIFRQGGEQTLFPPLFSGCPRQGFLKCILSIFWY